MKRRNFLKTLGITAGAITLGSAGQVLARKPVPDEYIASEIDATLFQEICGESVAEIIPPRRPYRNAHGSHDVMVPETWASAAAALLNYHLVGCKYITRDCDDTCVANYDDVVNIRAPGPFRTRRHRDDDILSFNDANFRNIQVPLNQQWYASFVIKDGEGHKTFEDLKTFHLIPAMQAVALSMEDTLFNTANREVEHFRQANEWPHDWEDSRWKDSLLNVREKFNRTMAYARGRHVIVPDGTRFFDKCVEDGDRCLGFNAHPCMMKESSLAFHRDAITLVTRREPYVPPNTGHRYSHTAKDKMVVSCMMSYDVPTSGVRVDISVLGGLTILNHEHVAVISPASRPPRETGRMAGRKV